MNVKKKSTPEQELYELLASLESPEEVRALLDDMCTPNEIEHMAQRLECAKRLMQGETYEEVIAGTEISSATLSRVSRCIRHVSGGYARVLKKRLDAESHNE